MKAYVISATPSPIYVVSVAAGNCYGKHDYSEKRVKNCVKAGHTSVLEHVSVTFRIEGVSRACMAQITRHRMASFCIESQRYCKYDEDFFNGEWYVMPSSFEDKAASMVEFEHAVTTCAEEYTRAVDAGVKPEDARYLLPEATKTNIVMTMNMREIFHFFDMRRDKAAQWEIRQLAEAMAKAMKVEDWQMGFFADLWEECRK